jgi:hypothetical protein
MRFVVHEGDWGRVDCVPGIPESSVAVEIVEGMNPLS